jgi:AcrR family transcriptional regulator
MTVRTMTISAVERASGFPRSTIYYYVREGVLPPPSRTARDRFLFTDEHVRLLARIGELKRSGCSLAQVRTALKDELAATADGGDLGAQESERIRKAILRVATQEFLAKGYRQTSVKSIVRKSGVTPNVFYSYFPSKSHLLVECFGTFIAWSMASVGPRVNATDDLGERLLLRLTADARASAFEADVLAMARTAGREDAAERAKLVQQAWAGIVRNIEADLHSVRPAATDAPEPDLELLAYGLIGALHDASLRASWGNEFDRADVLRSHLWLYLAVLAALRGESSVDAQMARYETAIRALTDADAPPPTPFED